MIDLPDARAQLDAFERDLVDAHHSAVAQWARAVRETPAFTAPFDSTTRANIIQNHVCREVEIRLADRSGVVIPDKLPFFGVLFGQDILMRFKYVGAGGPNNVATTQQRELARQEFNGELMLALGDSEGQLIAPPTLLTCGYTLDGHRLGRLEIRRDCKGHQPWYYDIYGGETIVQPTVFPGMVETAKPARVSTTRRKTAQGEDAAQAGRG